MNPNLPTRLKRLLGLARGLGEPRFDPQKRITNWPEDFVNEFQQLSGELRRSRNDVELRECADILNATASPDVPDTLLQILSRATFDNPSTPLH